MDSCFLFLLQEDDENSATQSDSSNNDVNNNPLTFSSPNYECQLESSTKGVIRLFAGDYKHTFFTYDRPIVSFSILGEVSYQIHLIFPMCFIFRTEVQSDRRSIDG